MDLPLQSLFSRMTPLATAALDALLPPRCLGCGEQVDRQGNFCAPCWSDLGFIASPQCQCCGLPFNTGVVHAFTCAACLARPPQFNTARSVWRHEGTARAAVLGFKYGDKPQLARALAAYLVRAAEPALQDARAVIVPVPLHRWRLLGRRYNQAAELARQLSSLSRRRALPAALVRTRRTLPQQGLSLDARERNVNRAFRLDARAVQLIAGRPVILVDDVLTTGATASACARLLLEAGATRVDVVTLTRAVLTNP